MNIFRLIGDLSHLGAIIILMLKIWKTRSCAGVSGKTQILFLIVFTTRYLDLFTNFVSAYNTAMKIIFLTLIYTTVFFIYRKFRATYHSVDDTFRVEFILIPTFALAVLENHKSDLMEILWTFSIYLESLAILPQLFMITNTGSAETITYHYLFALGIYRALYIINWIYRYYTEGLYDMIVIVAGCVQTVFFLDFFYLYATRVLKGKDVILPV